MKTILLETPKTVQVKESHFKNNLIPLDITEFTLLNIADNCVNKVTASVRVLNHPTKLLVLWEGEVYDNIGEWTQAQAETRIKELI